MATGDDLDEWHRLLDEAEADLAEREAVAAGPEWSPPEVAALASERNALAAQRDEFASAADRLAEDRDADAAVRDSTAAARDQRHAGRDDPGRADRVLSAGNREDSAEDRADASTDRHYARVARQAAAGSRRATIEQSAEIASQLESLKRALRNRTVIGRATGQLSERYGVDPERALKMLVHLASDSKLDVHIVAAQVLARGEQRRRAEETQIRI